MEENPKLVKRRKQSNFTGEMCNEVRNGGVFFLWTFFYHSDTGSGSIRQEQDNTHHPLAVWDLRRRSNLEWVCVWEVLQIRKRTSVAGRKICRDFRNILYFVSFAILFFNFTTISPLFQKIQQEGKKINLRSHIRSKASDLI